MISPPDCRSAEAHDIGRSLTAEATKSDNLHLIFHLRRVACFSYTTGMMTTGMMKLAPHAGYAPTRPDGQSGRLLLPQWGQ
jgi:hypothetical protein